MNDGGNIVVVDDGMESITGFKQEQLLGSSFYAAPYTTDNVSLACPQSPPIGARNSLFRYRMCRTRPQKKPYILSIIRGFGSISLDSNKAPELQVPWFRKVLEDNPNKWTIVTFHHPVFSPGSDRDNRDSKTLETLIDEFKVDLVLSGHDHTYARTGQVDTTSLVNVPSGYQQAYDPEIGTVYVVSVSGPKMYRITKGNYAKRLQKTCSCTRSSRWTITN